MRPTFFPGHELRERREELGLSVYEAFRKTRVPANYIEALERGDLPALPSSCYATGFLKTYCEFLGLEAERYVDNLRACLRPSVVRFLRRENRSELRLPAWVNDAAAWAVITVLVLLAWVTYAVVVQPQAEPVHQRVEAGTLELPPSVPSGENPGF
jgi:cytoskeletal protein RodZ